ncbi:MAG: S41 family peptidase [Thermoanaerobaculales bacterium]|nr:S41 family peptidase [Thermoanaerobaculales bacterium]
MKRFRQALLIASVVVVTCFAGLLTAGLTSDESLYQALGNLAEVVHLVESEYVDELDQEVLALSLDAGILESLDPWAAVIAADEAAAYEELLTGPPAYGLGLSLRLGSAAVRFAFPGSPADDAGLETWEVIEKIDEVYTRGRPLWQIAFELSRREAAGDIVSLTVMDRQVDERREVELIPRDWQPGHATLDEVEEIRVLTITSLTRDASAVIGELAQPEAPDVLDLRGLVWGHEEEAVAVADLFVDEGTIAMWKGREAGTETISATDGSAGAPPVVLIDHDTEGVGEILAAALKRAGATLVGTTTMGHAPHMRLVRRGDLNLWIPVGRWLGPDDQPIRQEGVGPDEEVDAAEDEDADPVLDRAIELLTEEEEPAEAA